MMTIDDLNARHAELLRRRRELAARGDADKEALFMLEEELLDVRAKMRAFTPGQKNGARKRAAPEGYAVDQQQFRAWEQEVFEDSASGIMDTRSVVQGVLRDRQDLISTRQLEVLELWGRGMSKAEVARRLGICRSTVSRTLNRAEKKMSGVFETRNRVRDHLHGDSLDLSKASVADAVAGCISASQVVTLYLYFGEYLSMDDVGILIGRNRSTVSRTVHRALVRITKAFAIRNIWLKHVESLYAHAYRAYLESYGQPRLMSPDACKPYWGRDLLKSQFHTVPRIQREYREGTILSPQDRDLDRIRALWESMQYE